MIKDTQEKQRYKWHRFVRNNSSQNIEHSEDIFLSIERGEKSQPRVIYPGKSRLHKGRQNKRFFQTCKS